MRTAALPLIVLCLSWNGVVQAEVSGRGLDVLNRYLEARVARETALRGARMHASFEARLPRLARKASLDAMRTVSEEGRILYWVQRASGDPLAVREVINRYLALDSGARDPAATAIVPANYRFRFRAIVESGSARIFVFHLTPRRRAAGLFKGELEVDAETGMPVRESGQLVKSPSVLIRKVSFVREYRLYGGVAVPRRVSTRVETRVAGRAELDVVFDGIALAGDRGGPRAAGDGSKPANWICGHAFPRLWETSQ